MNASGALVAARVAMTYPVACRHSGFIFLFDGRSLEGWEGDETVFRVMDGAIVGGTLDAPSPESTHLCTTETCGEFELRMSGRIEGNQNAGVGFRCQRLPDSYEVAGYQADMGFLAAWAMPIVSDVTRVEGDDYPLWGSLLDEFRKDPGRYPDPAHPYRLIAVADREVVERALRVGEPPNNGIEQTNGGPHKMTPFAAHPGRWADEDLDRTARSSACLDCGASEEE